MLPCKHQNGKKEKRKEEEIKGEKKSSTKRIPTSTKNPLKEILSKDAKTKEM